MFFCKRLTGWLSRSGLCHRLWREVRGLGFAAPPVVIVGLPAATATWRNNLPVVTRLREVTADGYRVSEQSPSCELAPQSAPAASPSIGWLAVEPGSAPCPTTYSEKAAFARSAQAERIGAKRLKKKNGREAPEEKE